MKIICSWCRGEGHQGLVGEKAPLDDRRETHGICVPHRLAVQARWKDALAQLVSVQAERHSGCAGVASQLPSVTSHCLAGRNITPKSDS